MASQSARVVARVRAHVFGDHWNPSGAHTGRKFLQRLLRGPRMMEWYPKPPHQVHEKMAPRGWKTALGVNERGRLNYRFQALSAAYGRKVTTPQGIDYVHEGAEDAQVNERIARLMADPSSAKACREALREALLARLEESNSATSIDELLSSTSPLAKAALARTVDRIVETTTSAVAELRDQVDGASPSSPADLQALAQPVAARTGMLLRRVTAQLNERIIAARLGMGDEALWNSDDERGLVRGVMAHEQFMPAKMAALENMKTPGDVDLEPYRDEALFDPISDSDIEAAQSGKALESVTQDLRSTEQELEALLNGGLMEAELDTSDADEIDYALDALSDSEPGDVERLRAAIVSLSDMAHGSDIDEAIAKLSGVVGSDLLPQAGSSDAEGSADEASGAAARSALAAQKRLENFDAEPEGLPWFVPVSKPAPPRVSEARVAELIEELAPKDPESAEEFPYSDEDLRDGRPIPELDHPLVRAIAADVDIVSPAKNYWENRDDIDVVLQNTTLKKRGKGKPKKGQSKRRK